MSLSNRGRRLSVAPLAGVERQGRRSLGSGSLAVGIWHSLLSGSHFIQGTHPLPGLQSRFHPGQGTGGRSPSVAGQGSDRACSSSFSRLLQPVIYSDESLRSVEAGHRPLATESEGATGILQDGDSPVCTSVSTCWGLDGVSRLEGCVLAGANASGISQVPQIRGGREGVPIQSSLLWSLHRSSGFHPGHGPCFGIPSPDRDSVASLSRRLVDSSLLSGVGSSCSGVSTSALQGSGNRRQLGEVTADSNSADGLSRSSFGFNLFQGFSCPEESREASLNWRRILVLRKAACVILAGAFRSAVVHDPARTGRKASNEISAVHASKILGSCGPDSSGRVDSGHSSRSRLVARSRTSGARRGSGSGVPSARLVVRRLGRGLGGASGRGSYFRPLGSGGVRRLHQRQGALSHRGISSLVRSTNKKLLSGDICGQRYGGDLSAESMGNTITVCEFHHSEDFTMGEVSASAGDSSIHHGASQCLSGFIVSPKSSLGLRMDAEDRSVSGAPEEVASVHRSVCHLSQSPLFSIFFSVLRSERSGYGCAAPELGWVAGVCLSTLVAHSDCSEEAPVVLGAC